MPYCKLSDKSKPKPDRLKAVLLERMRSEGKNQMDIAEAMSISLRTFERLMTQHTEDWTVNQITLALRAVDVRLTMRTLNYELSDSN